MRALIFAFCLWGVGWRSQPCVCQEGMTTTPVFLLGKFHGLRILADYGPRGHKESDTTKQLTHTPTPAWGLDLVAGSPCTAIPLCKVKSQCRCLQMGKPASVLVEVSTVIVPIAQVRTRLHGGAEMSPEDRPHLPALGCWVQHRSSGGR